MKKATISIALGFTVLLAFACSGNGEDGQPTKTVTPEPAAETLAFIRNGDIWLIDADGGNERRLVDTAARREAFGGFSWSPGGGQIAFTYGSGFANPSLDNSEIYVVDVDGSRRTNLTNSSRQDFQPAWSPDGAHIAFASGGDGGTDIYVMNADGSGVVSVTNGPGGDFAPAWSPDGSRIALFCFQPDGKADICVLDADGSMFTNLTNSPAHDLQPVWSPDSLRVAYISGPVVTERIQSIDYEVYIANADGSVRNNLTNHPASDFDPVWSPDGARIAFISVRDGERQIYVMNADGSGVVSVTNGPGGDFGPAWAPDGTRIAFTRVEPVGNLAIYVMNADGSAQTRLADGTNPAWQPHP